jgi:hypothetical protein
MARGSTRDLPTHVVVACDKVSDRKRYGVKMKFGGKQLRIGSRFADVSSAKRVAEAFRLIAEPSRDSAIFRVHETSLEKLRKDTSTILVYEQWGSKTQKLTLATYLTEWISSFRSKYGPDGKRRKKSKRAATKVAPAAGTGKTRAKGKTCGVHPRKRRKTARESRGGGSRPRTDDSGMSKLGLLSVSPQDSDVELPHERMHYTDGNYDVGAPSLLDCTTGADNDAILADHGLAVAGTPQPPSAAAPVDLPPSGRGSPALRRTPSPPVAMSARPPVLTDREPVAAARGARKRGTGLRKVTPKEGLLSCSTEKRVALTGPHEEMYRCFNKLCNLVSGNSTATDRMIERRYLGESGQVLSVWADEAESWWREDHKSSSALVALESQIAGKLGPGGLILYDSDGILMENELMRRFCRGSIFYEAVHRTGKWTTPISQIPKWIWAMTQVSLGLTDAVSFDGDFKRLDVCEYVSCMFTLSVHTIEGKKIFSAWMQPKNLLDFGWIDSTVGSTTAVDTSVCTSSATSSTSSTSSVNSRSKGLWNWAD